MEVVAIADNLQYPAPFMNGISSIWKDSVIAGTQEETTDADVADDAVEDADRLRRRPYHKLADRSHRYSAEERECNMRQTPLNDTTIGIIVSRVAST